MVRRVLAGCAVVSGMVMVAACGDGDANDLSGEYEIPPGLLEQHLEDASEFQRELIEDGIITFADYERAVYATVACLEERGVDVVEGPELTGRNVYQFTYAADDREQGPVVYWECYEEHQVVIDRVWAGTGQENPTEEELEEARAALEACLRGAGIDLPGGASSADFAAVAESDPTIFQPCSEEVSDEFDMPGFAGFG